MGNSQKSDFNPQLNGLRGLASFMVYLYHVQAGAFSGGFLPEHIPSLLTAVIDTGQFGVDIFFMISGYLIASSLLRHNNVGRFMLDRYLRIYPVFVVLLVPIFVLGPLIHYEFLAELSPGEWLLHLISNLLFLPGVLPLPIGLPVAWSLSYEMVFYLLSALIFITATRLGRAPAWILGLLIGGFLVSFHPRACFFAAGALVFFQGDLLQRLMGRLHQPLLLLLLFYAFWHGWHELAPGATPLGATPVSGVLFLLGAFIVGLFFFNAVIPGYGPLCWLLRVRVLQYMGTISYSFYLWHTIFMFMTKRLVAHGLAGEVSAFTATFVFGITSLLLALLASHVSYTLVETRLAGWLRRKLLARRKIQPQPA